MPLAVLGVHKEGGNFEGRSDICQSDLVLLFRCTACVKAMQTILSVSGVYFCSPYVMDVYYGEL